jgi:hypothetical protein
MQIDDPFLPAKPFALNIPLEVWLVVSLFCDANFAYKRLRAVCRRFKRAFGCLPELDPCTLRHSTWAGFFADPPLPPEDIGLFQYRLSRSSRAARTFFVMNFCLQRLRSVVRLELDLGHWASSETIQSLQHIGTIQNLRLLAVRLGGNRLVTPPLLHNMLKHWSRVATLEDLDLDCQRCSLGNGALGALSSTNKGQRWQLSTLMLNFSMNDLGCTDAMVIGEFLTRLPHSTTPPLRCVVNVEVNSIRLFGADLLARRAASVVDGAHVHLRMWLNDISADEAEHIRAGNTRTPSGHMGAIVEVDL